LSSARRHRVGDRVGQRRHGGSQVDRSVGVERIDAYHRDPARIAPVLHQVGEPASRLVATRRGSEVLEIDDQHVGAAAPHGFVRVSISTRAEQPSASQIRGENWHGATVRRVWLK